MLDLFFSAGAPPVRQEQHLYRQDLQTPRLESARHLTGAGVRQAAEEAEEAEKANVLLSTGPSCTQVG